MSATAKTTLKKRDLVAVYVVDDDKVECSHVQFAVKEILKTAQKLVVVCPDKSRVRLENLLPSHEALHFVEVTSKALTLFAVEGYMHGARALSAEELENHLLLASAETLGPLRPVTTMVDLAMRKELDVYAPYWRAAKLDPRLQRLKGRNRLPCIDFAILSPRALGTPQMRDFLREEKRIKNDWDALINFHVPFSAVSEQADLKIGYPFRAGELETYDPRLFEVDKIVKERAACIPLEVFSLDPVLHDLNAIDLRSAVDTLRLRHRNLYRCLIDFTRRMVPLRDFTTIADQYEILPVETGTEPDKPRSFGRVAVFIHAFYAEMMPEFWTLLEKLPCEMHVFITTATEDARSEIQRFLRNKGLRAEDFTVRVTEQNRGRDMSSLFITWRDIVLSDEYEVALRLHSKRTPQVSRQVGESFKSHLFDNLVATPGYVSNLLDLFEEQDDIGLIIPPVIHMGFGTLGHSWFNNRKQVIQYLREMQLDVVPDKDTPVTAYGTMYWFRIAALRPMFEREWAWEDYNPEPHHIDGGLAHVQERLIGYVVQGTGFRVISVMTPRYAARSYAKLEYKLQKLAALTTSGSILEQVRELEIKNSTFKSRSFKTLRGIYGNILIRYPKSRNMIRPLKNLVMRIYN